MVQHTLDCVFIETTTACTRKCPWCTHRYYDIKPNFMQEKLFDKIIADLASINFKGRLSFYLNGEPLLDKRLPDRVKAGKQACPEAFAFIISNGDLFTAEKAASLINAGLDAIKINAYDEKSLIKIRNEIKKIDKNIIHHVRLYDNTQKTDWTSRGGTVPFGGNLDEKQRKIVCLRPFRQLYIAHNGIVAQCCSDALNKYVMGDINNQSILEVWNGEPFNKVRKGLIGKGELSELCKICDLERTYENVNDLKKLYEKPIDSSSDFFEEDGGVDINEKSSFFNHPLKTIKQFFISRQQ
jgi:MoaA/NifB/PqqE/SkfB family radical SAM enzyme